MLVLSHFLQEPDVKRVSLDRTAADADAHLELVGPSGVRFGIETDPDYPGQFRVLSSKMETMVKKVARPQKRGSFLVPSD